MTKAELRTSGGTLLKEQRNTYDVADRRIGVWEDDNGDGVGTQRWTVYDGDNAYADFNGSGSLTKRYLYGPAMDWLFARIGATGDLDWYLTDRLDSVRQIVDVDGTVLDALTYDSFGKPLTETNPANGDRFTYTGRESDKLFSLLFYRARYYSFDIGRFISADPIGFGGGDTNLYRYVGNGPTNWIDPTGLQGQSPPQPPAGSRDLIEFNLFNRWDVRSSSDQSMTTAQAGAMAVGVIRGLPLTIGKNVLTLIWEVSPGKLVSWAARAVAAGYRFVQVSGKWIVQKFVNGRWVQLTERQGAQFAREFLPWTCGTPLSTTARNVLRRDAREIWERAAGALRTGQQVHHRIPLEWAHLFPELDPNRLANLFRVANQQSHSRITNAWNVWRQSLNGRIPTAAEVLQQARRIDQQLGHLMTAVP